MKRIVLGLAASVAAIALAPAASATICIGVAVNGGATTNVGCDGGSGSVNYNTTTGGYFYNVSGTGSPLLTAPNILTQSVNILSQTGTAGVVDVYITQTGNTTYTGGLLSTFTSNSQVGLNAQLTSYYDTNNGLFTGVQLANAAFMGDSAVARTAAGANGLGTVTGPWSETVRYRLTFTGGAGSNFNGTVNISAVPEPATWGLMLLGFGAMGGMLRTRRQTPRVRFA